MIKLRNGVVVALVVLLYACSSLPPQSNRTQTYAMNDTQTTRLGAAFGPKEQEHAGLNAFHLLADAVDALVARIVLTEAADRTLDLQYYIWHDDLVGRQLVASLLRAADRGVRVRVLLDDLGTNAEDQSLLALTAQPNIQIRLFNPVANRSFKKAGAVVEFSRVNRRMHNKVLIADNQAAILGGRNIGDEYFGASSVVAFGDLDVLVHGPIVRDASKAFDEYWNSDASYPIDRLTGHSADPQQLAALRVRLDAYLASQQDTPYVVQARERLVRLIHSRDADFTWGEATLLYDDPSKITRGPEETQGHLMSQWRALDFQAAHEMLIVSPYFVPGKTGVAWIRAMTGRGVQVTVLTNSLAATDVAAVHAGYERYRKDLLAAGVHLYEMKPVVDEKTAEKHQSIFGSSKASLHAKTYVFDRSNIFIGSMNLDPRSIVLNTEIGVYCKSEALAMQVVDGIEANLDRIAWRVEQRIERQKPYRLDRNER